VRTLAPHDFSVISICALTFSMLPYHSLH
jgi:hypothetical protein